MDDKTVRVLGESGYEVRCRVCGKPLLSLLFGEFLERARDVPALSAAIKAAVERHHCEDKT